MTIPRLAFPLLLGTFVLLALLFSIIIPLGEAPDEVSHFAYIQYLTTHRQLPVGEGAVLGEAHQPPLYYILGALATAWIPQSERQPIANPDWSLDNPQTPNLLLHTRQEAFPYQDASLAWHLVRILSILFGAITVWATWRIASRFLPDHTWLALAATAFVAFLPEFLFISAAVNNDNLVIMLSTLAVFQLLRITDRSSSWRDYAVLGIILGLAPLAKLSGLVVWPFVGFILLLFAFQSRQWKGTIPGSAFCFALAVAVLVPWVAYNWQTKGDPLGWSLVLSVTPVRENPMAFGDWVGIGIGLFTSFWGRFGGALQIHMAGAVYLALGIAVIGALAGWIGYVRDALRKQMPSNVQKLFVWFLVFWLLLLSAFLRWTLTVLGTDQARQLFPGLPLLAIAFVVGLARWAPARSKLVTGIWLAVSVGFGAIVLFYLNGLYTVPPHEIKALAVLSGANKSSDFGKTIRVLDYRVSPLRVSPGSTIDVEIQWQALEPPQESYWLLLQLGGQGEPIANRDGTPADGRLTTDWWKTGQAFTSHHSLVVPPGSSPGTYVLRLGLHPFGRWDWLPVQGRDMLSLENIVVSAPQ